MLEMRSIAEGTAYGAARVLQSGVSGVWTFVAMLLLNVLISIVAPVAFGAAGPALVPLRLYGQIGLSGLVAARVVATTAVAADRTPRKTLATSQRCAAVVRTARGRHLPEIAEIDRPGRAASREAASFPGGLRRSRSSSPGHPGRAASRNDLTRHRGCRHARRSCLAICIRSREPRPRWSWAT